MYKGVVLYLVIVSFAIANGKIFDFEKFHNYTRLFGFTKNETNNELWQGIIRDCSKKVTFSCIQKNAYTYLDNTLLDYSNVTVFEGFSLVKNNLDYESCIKDDPKDSLLDNTISVEEGRGAKDGSAENKIDDDKKVEDEEEEDLSPLEEITHALRKKALKFLATRDYQVQLPRFIGAGAGFKISPREIDENGALIRIDFDTRAIEEHQQGRLFFIKKIKKQIQNKLLTGLLLLILLIKIIKLKFMFVIPFLFGVGTAKKLFLKLLLFLVPAFAHVFKLCSSYYSSYATKYHHHHHKVAHHHHHIPVPVPVPVSKPVYYDHPPPSHSSGPPGPSYILDEDFNGYDYAHPHIQYRKDIEELKEWGIEPYDESYDQLAPQSGVVYPGPPNGPNSGSHKFSPKFPGPLGVPFPPNAKPIGFGFADKISAASHHPQSLAYSAYAPHPPPPSPPRQPVPAASLPVSVIASPPQFGPPKPPATQPTKQQQQQQQQQQTRVGFNQPRNPQQSVAPAPAAPVAPPPTSKPYDDNFYGPIVERLDEIFSQLRFYEESCRERLICSMYKNPTLYAPHSNLVSNELSRDPQELQQGNSASASSQRFYRYLNAARLGQDGDDCLKSFQCNIVTE